jgi:DNA-binding NarL/FixJ family response regulator
MFTKISVREQQVLKMLCEGKSLLEIANEIKVSNKTVATYKTRLLQKLKVGNVMDLVNKALSLHIV